MLLFFVFFSILFHFPLLIWIKRVYVKVILIFFFFFAVFLHPETFSLPFL